MDVNEKNATAISQKLTDLESQLSVMHQRQDKMEGLLRMLAAQNQELKSQLLNMQTSRMGHGPTA